MEPGVAVPSFQGSSLLRVAKNANADLLVLQPQMSIILERLNEGVARLRLRIIGDDDDFVAFLIFSGPIFLAGLLDAHGHELVIRAGLPRVLCVTLLDGRLQPAKVGFRILIPQLFLNPR